MHTLNPITKGKTEPSLKTVTVTAQHREETLQEVPVAVSAVQGTSIIADGVRSMGDITTFIPNASAKNPDGDGRPRWYIRGLGTGDTGAATVYPVGIYADDKPTFDTDGYGTIGFGSKNERIVNGAIGGTLVPEKLAARISLYSEERDGFQKNLIDDHTYGEVNKKAV
eukprot:gene15101-18271_t